jgi:hypothetical protein
LAAFTQTSQKNQFVDKKGVECREKPQKSVKKPENKGFLSKSGQKMLSRCVEKEGKKRENAQEKKKNN